MEQQFQPIMQYDDHKSIIEKPTNILNRVINSYFSDKNNLNGATKRKLLKTTHFDDKGMKFFEEEGNVFRRIQKHIQNNLSERLWDFFMYMFLEINFFRHTFETFQECLENSDDDYKRKLIEKQKAKIKPIVHEYLENSLRSEYQNKDILLDLTKR